MPGVFLAIRSLQPKRHEEKGLDDSHNIGLVVKIVERLQMSDLWGMVIAEHTYPSLKVKGFPCRSPRGVSGRSQE